MATRLLRWGLLLLGAFAAGLLTVALWRSNEP